jgi:hypothetical protein
MRTIVDLRDDQVAALEALCAAEHISRAEAVRQAVDLYLRERKREAFRNAFGSWRHKKLDGLEYTRAIREEWDECERGLRQRLPD